jgi:hypothetical protein
MQLRCVVILAGCVLFPLLANAQDDLQKKARVGEVEIDVLSSYYEQAGDHSAVEGGVGTQTLSDKVFSVSVSVPIDSVKLFSLSVSADTYSSASSDHIDGVGSRAVLSTPSAQDTRVYGNLSYSRIMKKGTTLSIGAGFSSEFDVKSASLQLGVSKESSDRNNEVSLHLKGYYDKWELIFPTEYRFRNNFNLPDIRKTFSADLSYARIIGKRLQALFSYELTYQNGLLSTPFHRIYFNDGIDFATRTGSIEKLPETRYKHAFGGRVSSYPFNWLIGRFFYRYYFDSYGINSHTFNVELPIKITRFISVYPFYRYYTQTAASWFKPFGEHNLQEEYYTSDYDLSGFNSNKLGLGARISPPMGLFRSQKSGKNKASALKGIEMRLGRYNRSDGLRSFIFSFGMNFGF